MFRIYETHANSTFLRFSLQTGEPQINISSTPPSNKFSIGAAINLTCIAWQTDEMMKKDKNTGPRIIDWFDPQDKPIGTRCKAGSTPARPLKCPLEVGALLDGKLGNYTCRASNGYNYCSTKVFQVDRQQCKSKNPNVKMPARRVKKSFRAFHCD